MTVAKYPRLTRLPRQSFFLLGVRGVGKSTWARVQFPGATRVDLLDEARYQDYLADPSVFAADLQAAPPGSWVVVDEIQRLPNLLNEVHRHIEDRHLNFALLGSSARKLLAGRALHKTMHPLTPAELGNDFELEAALDTGTIPLIWVADERRQVLESYVRLYFREEVRAEGLVRNLPGFARFLPIAALYHGQVVNISGIARDCGVARTTVQGYLEIRPVCPLSNRGYGCGSDGIRSSTGSIRGWYER
ncbi:MAG: ATP-binding protein [Alphaproteobacteria bacterium]|nr:ATP-binding protein [Alphaproteobacteria bacterium]